MTGDGSRNDARAVLTIDLGALVHNWRSLAQRVAPAECAAVVKANGYGLGLEEVTSALARAGCRTFFVAHEGEGARARAALRAETSLAGAACRVFVLNGFTAGLASAEFYAAHGLQPVLASFDEIAFWRASGRDTPAAIQVDTGINRLGIPVAALADLVRLLQDAPLPVDLIMSHFVGSEDSSDPRNAAQVAAFARVRAALPQIPASLANSSGIFLPQNPAFDLVRPGYALYGGNPLPGRANPMHPVVALHAPLRQLRAVATGETAGYNAAWRALRPSLLATIGVGYADGLPRSLSGENGRPGGEAIIGGRRCPIVGRVSMDLTILDVTDVPERDLRVGAPAELLGSSLSIDTMAERAGTIGYEILTRLGARYRRIYADT